MTSRREVLAFLGSVPFGAGAIRSRRLLARAQGDAPPQLAPGAPMSPERRALVDSVRQQVDGLDARFSAHTHTHDGVMPYRLYTPSVSDARKVPLVVYLHGSAGLGSDNQKQMGAGNILGTRVWTIPANQERFPCYVVVPQTDSGWVRYGPPSAGDSVARVVPGLGEGARLAFAVIEDLLRTNPIDPRRIYLTGQSMGGAGAWHMLAQRPAFFAAAAICCGSRSLDAVETIRTPLWNFHGDADQTVPVEVSRERIAALRKAGGRPFSTEYAAVGHNVWEWAYSEPALLPWIFSRTRG